MLLDISHKPAAWIRERFPGLVARCLELGFDLTAGPVPVVPGRALRLRRRRRRRQRPHHASATCARSARSPARASTAPTGSPRRRCSRACSGAGGPARPPPREAARKTRPAAAAGPALGARARARRPGADRAGLDGHPAHDVELRRPAALGAAPRPRRPHPRRAARRDRELLPARHDVRRPARPAQRRPDGPRHPPRGRRTTRFRKGMPLPRRWTRLDRLRYSPRPHERSLPAFRDQRACRTGSSSSQKSGAHIVVAEPRWPGFFELAKREKPFAIAIDFSQRPVPRPRDRRLPVQGQGDEGSGDVPPARPGRPGRGRRRSGCPRPRS